MQVGLQSITEVALHLLRSSHTHSFRPETLTCRPGQDTTTCLTADQISALHRIYADYYEADQTYVFGGYYPGGEKRYYSGLVGKTQFKIGRAYFQFMVTKYVSVSLCVHELAHYGHIVTRHGKSMTTMLLC